MPRRDLRAYLHDIAEACAAIEQGIAGRTFEQYRADRLVRSSMERELGIIGEAMNHALRLDPHLAKHITHARRIVDFRNVVIHGYHSLVDEVVWAILNEDVPQLLREIREIIRTI